MPAMSAALQHALHRILQKRLTNALALSAVIHRQACKQHDRHGMTYQPLGQTLGRFLPDDMTPQQACNSR